MNNFFKKALTKLNKLSNEQKLNLLNKFTKNRNI